MKAKELYKKLDIAFGEPQYGRMLGLFFLWFNGVLIGFLMIGTDAFSHPIVFMRTILGLYPWGSFCTVLFTNAATLDSRIIFGIPFVIAVVSFVWFFIKPTFKMYIIGTSVLYYGLIMSWLFRLYDFIF